MSLYPRDALLTLPLQSLTNQAQLGLVDEYATDDAYISPYMRIILDYDETDIQSNSVSNPQMSNTETLSRPLPLRLGDERTHDESDSNDGQSLNDNAAASMDYLSCDFMMFLIDMTFCFLILIGLLALLVLAFTVGIPYFPIISALSAQQISTCALSAIASVATGAIGLALSCFFKPKIDASIQNQESRLCCLA